MRKGFVFVWAFLIAASLAGPVLAMNGNGSTYVSDTIPTTMTAGTTYTPTVTMQNAGTSTWSDGSGSSDYNFGPPDFGASNAAATWGPRVDAGGVLPGATKVLTLMLTPTTPGTYTCRWQMLQETVEWFGAECTKTITVMCGAPPAETLYMAENFDSFSAGVLQGQSAPAPAYAWNVQQGTNVDQALVVAGGVTGKAVQLWHKSSNATMNITDGCWGPSWHINESPYNKKIKVSFKVKRVTSVGDTFWRLAFRDWCGTTTRSYGFLQGSDTSIQAFDTSGGDKIGSGSANQTIPNDGAYHTVDVIVDYKEPGPLGAGTPENNVYYYLDGNYFFSGRSDGGTTNTDRMRALDLTEVAGSTNEMKILFDDFTFSSSKLPVNVLTSPIPNDVYATASPTITWTRTWPCAWVSATQVKICASNDPTGSAVWESGDVSGANLSQNTGELPRNTNLWAFQRDKSTSGGYNPWTAGVMFRCAAVPPGTPAIVTPVGIIASRKPMITFTGDAHTLLQVKVTTDSAGSAVVFDSGVINSTGNGYATTALAPGSYYGFARIGTGIGWSGWSAGLAFTINTTSEFVDVRHMDEPNILITDTWWPNDGFGHLLNTTYYDGPSTSTTVSQENTGCGNVALKWNDRGASRSIRTHKLGSDTSLGNINLDNGVTWMWAVANPAEGGMGDSGGGSSWRRATNILMDKNAAGVTHFVVLRSYPDGIGIITDTFRALQAFGGGWHDQWHAWANTGEYHVIRLTGRNQVAGDFASTVWNVYVDEIPTPAITATGCLVGLDMESDASTWQTDAIGIGHGSSDSTGDVLFDWTAVNGSCDYAPGEWNPFSAGPFATITEAKALGVESRPVMIDGSMVITKVGTHVDWGPDWVLGTEDDVTVQDCYFVQDVAGSPIGGVRIVSSDNRGGAVAEGSQVTQVSGVMIEQGGCRSILNPTVTIEGAAEFAPTPLSMIAVGGPCLSQGPVYPDTTGTLVRVFGTVPAAASYAMDDPRYPLGYFIVYVDDGSGAIDGRELSDGSPIPGIRVVIDAADPFAIVPNYGDYVLLEGIAGYESITGGSYADARQILQTTLTIISSYPLSPLADFSATGGDGQATLSWITASDASFTNTMIRRKLNDYPADASDGVLVVNMPNSPDTEYSYVDTGLTNGTTYYYSEFVGTGGSYYSDPSYAVVDLPAEATIAQAKSLGDWQIRRVEGSGVTAVFDGFFYIEAEDRSSGIRIAWAQQAPAVGSKVDVTGVTRRTGDSERYIEAGSLAAVGSLQIDSVCLTNKSLGGQGFNYNPATGEGQCGTEDGVGLNNIGMLVTTTGVVTASGEDFFYIDDGTHARDASIFNGIRVLCGSLSKPERGKQVAITGISSISRVGGRLFRGIRPRIQSDIQITQ